MDDSRLRALVDRITGRAARSADAAQPRGPLFGGAASTQLPPGRLDESPPSTAPPQAPEWRNPALEALVVEDFEDEQRWRVWADDLSEHGDPRGELIACALSGLDSPELLAPLVPHLFGPLAPRLGRAVKVAWSHGLVSSATITPFIPVKVGPYRDVEGLEGDAAAVTRALLDLGVTRMVRHLAWGPGGKFLFDVDELLDVLEAWPHVSQLRSLGFERRLAWRHVTRLAALGRRLERLEHLRLAAVEGPPGDRVAFQVRSLDVKQPWVVAGGRWPKLQALTISLESDVVGLVELVASPLETLKSLTVRHSTALRPGSSAAVLRTLAHSPLVDTLETLEVTGDLRAGDVEGVIDCAASLRRLARLDLSSNFLDVASVARLQRHLPNAVFADQRSNEDESPELQDDDDVTAEE